MIEDEAWRLRAKILRFIPQALLLTVAIGGCVWLTRHLLPDHWLGRLALWGGGLAVLGLALLTGYLLLCLARRRIAIHLCHYLLFDYQDRALAGIKAALENGWPLVLYLRGFEDEKGDFDHYAIEGELVNALRPADAFGRPVVAVALGSPQIDLTNSVDPIPRVFFGAGWEQGIATLVSRASFIVMVTAGAASGLETEVQEIVAQGKSERVFLIRPDPQESRASGAFDALIEGSGINVLDLGAKEGDPIDPKQLTPLFLALLTKLDDREELARLDVSGIRLARTSDQRRFAAARFFLFGLYGRRIARLTDYSRYATGLCAPSMQDPFGDIREAEAEKAQAGIEAGRPAAGYWV